MFQPPVFLSSKKHLSFYFWCGFSSKHHVVWSPLNSTTPRSGLCCESWKANSLRMVRSGRVVGYIHKYKEEQWLSENRKSTFSMWIFSVLSSFHPRLWISSNKKAFSKKKDEEPQVSKRLPSFLSTLWWFLAFRGVILWIINRLSTYAEITTPTLW